MTSFLLPNPSLYFIPNLFDCPSIVQQFPFHGFFFFHLALWFQIHLCCNVFQNLIILMAEQYSTMDKHHILFICGSC